MERELHRLPNDYDGSISTISNAAEQIADEQQDIKIIDSVYDISRGSGPNHPIRGYTFRTTAIGKNVRCCHVEWFDKWPWLRYSATGDFVLCFVCANATERKVVQVHSRRDPAFAETGFRNWKKATEKFVIHEKSDAQIEAVQVLKNLERVPINAVLSEQTQNEQLIA